MRHVILSASIAGLLFVCVVAADTLRHGQKVIHPRVSFEGIEKYADHVFYLRFQPNRDGGPYQTIEVKDTTPVNLHGGHLSNMSLLAMERKEFDHRAADDPTLNWLSARTGGVMQASLTTPPTRGPDYELQVPVTVYRVTVNSGGLYVQRMPRIASPAESPAMWIAGIVSALSLAMVGIWFARRRRT
jgi:hypothetical protein